MMRKAVCIATMVVCLIGVVGLAEDLAELHVVKVVLDPPSTIYRGTVVEVMTRVMNTGSRTADGFSISLFTRLQGDSGSWTLEQTIEDVSLPPSQQDFGEQTFTLDTTDLDVGTYDLRVIADSANQISEVDELNNELRTTMTIVPSSLGLPDLQPLGLAYAHENPSSSDDMDPWNVTAQVRNLGTTQAGQFTIAFLVDGEEFDRKIQFVLPAGGTTDVVAKLDPLELGLEAGVHSVSVVVDPEGQNDEQDEANNSIVGAITLQSLELAPLTLAFDKSTVRLDEELEVSAEITNTGEGVAKGVEVAFYAGHIKFASELIDILGRGMSATVTGTLDPEKDGLSDAPAVYQIRVVVDPSNALHEADEANNEMVRTLTILPPEVKHPELHPESLELTPPSPAERGRADTITVTSVIKNTGRAAADGFDVGFYYRIKGSRRWNPISCADDVSCRNVTLAAGTQARIVGVLKVFELGLLPGIYEIRVVADSTNVVDELDGTNNELLTTLTLLESRLPDLSFCQEGGLAIEPYLNVQRGQTVRLTPCVTNLGEQDAGRFTIRLSYCQMMAAGSSTAVQCSDVYSSAHLSPAPEIEIASLGIGETASVPVMLETRDLEPGQYTVRAEINPGGEVAERSGLNNILELPLTVLGPDLAVVDLTTSPRGVVDQAVADELQVSATIINAGVVATGEFNVRIRLFQVSDQGLVAVRVHMCGEAAPRACGSAEYFCEETLPGIGVLVPEQVRWTLDLAQTALDAGQYIVTVEVDCDSDVDGICSGRISEHNELNNVLELPLTILPRPADLVIKEPIEFPSERPVDYGEVVPIKATIANIGGSTADGACTTTPSCGIGIEFLVYEPGTGAEDGEQLLRITPAEPIHSLGPGEEIQVTALLETDRLDPFVTDYRVLIRVDPSHSIEELDESNNDIELPLVIRLLPADLLITETVMYAEGELVRYGDAVPIRATIANVGFSTAQAACTSVPSCGVDVEFLVYVGTSDGGDELLRIPTTETIDALEPGEEVQVLGVLETDRLDPLVADYRVHIIVDPSNRIEEINESNNDIELPLAIRLLPADLSITDTVMYAEGELVRYGDAVPIRATIANIGFSTAPAACTSVPSCGVDVEFLVYVGTTDSGDELLRILPDETIDALEPGEEVQVIGVLETDRLDPLVTDYRIRIIVDPSNRIEEINESDNEVVLPLALQPLPADLAIAGPISFPDGTPAQYGDVVPISTMIANVGGSTARGACGIGPSCSIGVEFLIYEYGIPQDEAERIVRIVPYEAILSLDPGDVVQVTAFLKTELLDPFMTGYRVCVRVDPTNSIPELDESNNELCTPPQLELYPPPPDLRLALAEAGDPLVQFDPMPPVEYEDQPIRAHFSIVNDSRSASTGFNVALRLRPVNVEGAQWIELDRLAVTGLAAGETRPLFYDIVLPSEEEEGGEARDHGLVPPGVYEFCIAIDVDDFIPETNEQNNTYCTPIGLIILDGGTASGTVTVEEGADLSIRSMCAQVGGGWLGTSRISATIENVGTADAGPFTVTAYYIPAVGADPVTIVDVKHRTRYDGLAAGEDTSFRQDFDASGLEDGLYPVFIVVDAKDEVIETDENNNVKYDTLWIR